MVGRGNQNVGINNRVFYLKQNNGRQQNDWNGRFCCLPDISKLDWLNIISELPVWFSQAICQD